MGPTAFLQVLSVLFFWVQWLWVHYEPEVLEWWLEAIEDVQWLLVCLPKAKAPAWKW